MANFSPALQFAQRGRCLVRVATVLYRMRTGVGGGADSYRGCFQKPGKGTRGKSGARFVFGSDTPGSGVLPNRVGVQSAYPGSLSRSLSFSVGNNWTRVVDAPRDLLVVDGGA